MGILYKTKGYLCGNLEYEQEGFTKEWRNYFKEKVKDMGITCFSPLDKVFKDFGEPETHGFQTHLKDALQRGEYQYVHEKMKVVRDRDLRMVDLANFLVTVINPNIPTIGTIDEVLTGLEQRKPVLMVIPGLGYKGLALWLTSYFKPHWVYDSIDGAINELKKIDSGEIKLNLKYWRIPNEEYL